MADGLRQRSLSERVVKAAKAGVFMNRKKLSNSAVNHFEQAIRELDAELRDMEPSSLEYGDTLRLRRKYEHRLRLASKLTGESDEIINSKDNGDQQPQPWMITSLETSDEEMAAYEEAFDKDPIPSSMASMSYWYLRRVRDAVVKGGLLNKKLLFPRQAWYSRKARFSGVTAKISFLKDIASIITVQLEPLLKQEIPHAGGILSSSIKSIRSYRGMQADSDGGNSSSSDASSAAEESDPERDTERLVELARVFSKSRELFIASQNQLAKSFHFIDEEEVDGEDGAGRSHPSEQAGTEGDLPPPPSAQERDKASTGGAGGLVASLGSLGLGLGSSLVGGVGKGLTEGMSMVGNLGKNVKKIAEVGISRINASVSSSISDEELRIYTDLVVDVSERSQLCDAWYRYFEEYRSHLLERGQGQGQGQADEAGARGTSAGHPFNTRQLELTEAALTSLLMVSKFFKEVVGALLLRELEELLKSFVKAQLALALSTEYGE
jgi:hypothetical protein